MCSYRLQVGIWTTQSFQPSNCLARQGTSLVGIFRLPCLLAGQADEAGVVKGVGTAPKSHLQRVADPK